MQDLASTSETKMSRRLPPPEAWIKPEEWIDTKTGLILPGIKRIELPVDDRKFIIPDRAVQIVLDRYFKPEYSWGFDPHDPETKPDDHHFYHHARDYEPGANHGSMIPKIFRELPTVKGRMPRQFHNAIHDLTEDPEMPKLYDMQEYIDAYTIAIGAFRKLFMAAKYTVHAGGEFSKYNRTRANSKTASKDLYREIINREFMRSDFEARFEVYSQAVEDFYDTDHKDVITPNYMNLGVTKPGDVVRQLGAFVSRQSIIYPLTQYSSAAKDSNNLLTLAQVPAESIQ